jgi:hypothetical protein
MNSRCPLWREQRVFNPLNKDQIDKAFRPDPETFPELARKKSLIAYRQ